MQFQEALQYDTLVLGGGFAGVYCAKELARRMRKGDNFQAAIVSDDNYLVFQPMLPEVAAASISPRHVINPIRQMCQGIHVYKGRVTEIDTEAKTVSVNAGDFTSNVRIGFKQLVVALGAVVDLSRVPGMPEHALLMQNVGDAMKLRAHLIKRFEEANLVADPEIRQRLLRFVVVGGGYSGVETAGEIQDLMAHIHQYYLNIDEADFEVVLVHSGEVVLPTLSQQLGQYAQNKLADRGVRMVLGQRVRSVTAESVSLTSGEIIPAATVISTIGNSPNPLVTQLATDLALPTERGRLLADAMGRVKGHDWLWTAGDCSAMPLVDKPGTYCPPTAQFAQRQGTRVGKNVIASVDGVPPKPFTFGGLGELAAIGHRDAVANIMGVNLSGFLAWWLWRTIYLSKLPGIQRKVRVMVDWTLDLFFARDINLLSPQYSRLLKAAHLAPGDSLFKPGEPAFSLYFVKEGQIDIFDGERLVKEVKAGDYFGERALLEDKVWHYRAVAHEATWLIGLGADEFIEIIKGSEALRRIFQRSAKSYLSSEEAEALRNQVSEATYQQTAADIMNRQVDSLTPDMTVKATLRLLKAQRHGSYPVLDEAGKVIGVLKRDDVFDYLKSHANDGDKPLRELPLNQLPSIPESASVNDVVEMLLRSGRNKILVVNNEDQLQGLITLIDLFSGDTDPVSTSATEVSEADTAEASTGS